MSLIVVKNQIVKFLKGESSEVLAIKGPWGSGKTFTWNKTLQEIQKDNKIGYDRYSYVSLFGINTLESFKYMIFENCLQKEMIGTSVTLESFKENTKSLFEVLGRKFFGLVKDAPFIKSVANTINSVAFLSIRKIIICVDDLERRGNDLSLKEILGLISFLKEQRECKIVILLNDGEENLEDFQKYKEKVIDTELIFEPTPTESANIAFKEDGEIFKKLREFSIILEIKNIRVLKKIEKIVKEMESYYKMFDEALVTQILHSLTLFYWCHYCSNEGAPSLELVSNLSYNFWGIGGDKDTKRDLEKERYQRILNKYKYTFTDNFDLKIAEVVKSGYLSEESFYESANIKNQEIIASKSQNSFFEAWKIYHDSFENNEEEVVNEIYNSFRLNVKNINSYNLNGTVLLFRELGKDEKASELIDYYILSRKNEIEIFNLKDHNFFGDIKDSEIVDKFSKIYLGNINKETSEEILKRIIENKIWRPEDEIILSNTSVEEFYQIFKQNKGSILSKLVSNCLQFNEYSNANDNQKKIVNSATIALKKIGKEGIINKLRIKKFGITVED